MTSAMGDALGFAELLQYEREELNRWAEYFAAHPASLDIPFAPAEGAGSRMERVRHVVHHIAVVERRYADRLARARVTDFTEVPLHPGTALLDAARDANARLAGWLASASADDLGREIEFTTLSAGTLRASARKIVAHAIVHGIRHWAQVASVVRQHGAPGGWQHDLLFSESLR